MRRLELLSPRAYALRGLVAWRLTCLLVGLVGLTSFGDLLVGSSLAQEPAAEAAVPEAAVPEAAVPEAAVPEAAVPEAAVPEAAVPEAAGPEAAGPEAAGPPASVVPPAKPSAAPQVRRPAHLIRIPVPITDSVDERAKLAIDRVLSEWNNPTERPIVILEFWGPRDEAEGAGSEFERSLSLARYLVGHRVGNARTVAYLPRTIVGHAVLPILACEEIIMHPDAELGAAGIREAVIDPILRRGYTEIAERRRTIPEPVALGMLDRDLVVLRAETAAGPRYLLDNDLATLESQTSVTQVDTMKGRGDLGRFTGNNLRLTYGFVSHLAAERRELAGALGLSANALELDPSLGEAWRPIRIDVTGPITDSSVSRWQRGIDDYRRTNRANLICVVVDSAGGDPVAAVRFATYLSQFDGSEVRTVAYVSGVARGDAALLPFACDHIVMTPASVIGGDGAYQPNADETKDLVAAAKVLARDKSRRWSLLASMLDESIEVRRYALKGSDVAEYFCAEELAEQKDPNRYEAGTVVTEADKRLVLNGERAESFGVTRYLVAGFNDFRKLYQLDEAFDSIEPGWAHNFVDTLAQPRVAGTLLFFGGLALIFELSTPGIGLGAFVSCVCFALFFWSQFLNNTASVLEIVLFVTGLACIAIEIFALPGLGIFGLGGGALVIISLVLASQTFVIPRNDYQAEQFPKSLMVVGAAMGGMVVGVVFLRKYLDRAPFLNRMLLNPPSGEALEELQIRESLVSLDHLLHQTGVTATALRPAGKAFFGDQLVDVITDGEMIARETPVIVTEVRGNRVLVATIARGSRAENS